MDTSSCSPICLPSASHSRFSLGDSSPYCPPFAGGQGKWLWMKILCFGPLKKKQCLCLLWTQSLPGRQKPHFLSPLDVMWVADPGTGAPCCRAPSGAQASFLLERSSQSSVLILAYYPFSISAHPTALEVVSAQPWLKVSSSGSLRLVTVPLHSRWLFPSLVLYPVLFWEEVWQRCFYSATILWPLVPTSLFLFLYLHHKTYIYEDYNSVFEMPSTMSDTLSSSCSPFFSPAWHFKTT